MIRAYIVICFKYDDILCEMQNTDTDTDTDRSCEPQCCSWVYGTAGKVVLMHLAWTSEGGAQVGSQAAMAPPYPF